MLSKHLTMTAKEMEYDKDPAERWTISGYTIPVVTSPRGYSVYLFPSLFSTDTSNFNLIVSGNVGVDELITMHGLDAHS